EREPRGSPAVRGRRGADPGRAVDHAARRPDRHRGAARAPRERRRGTRAERGSTRAERGSNHAPRGCPGADRAPPFARTRRAPPPGPLPGREAAPTPASGQPPVLAGRPRGSQSPPLTSPGAAPATPAVPEPPAEFLAEFAASLHVEPVMDPTLAPWEREAPRP